MRINRNNLFLGILGYLLIVNLLVLFDMGGLPFRTILSFIFLTTVPGLLIMLILKVKNIDPWQYLVYTVGLSVAFLMFTGLIVNWALPFLGVDKPLSLTPLLTSLDFFLLTFWLIAKKRRSRITLALKFPKLDKINWTFLSIPIIFPVLSVLGAVILNNRGPNTLTMTMLGGIAAYVFAVVFLRNKLRRGIFPAAIFFISLSLLLMTSLRGWYTTGHDNQLEYLVFQLTQSDYNWDIADYRDPYNASLSITILPTIFSSFLNIDNVYIYKTVFQVIFSVVSICIFLLFKKYTTEKVAFLAAFSFMLFPTFINDLPMLNRQEIATLFFSLTLLTLFNKAIKQSVSKVLFLIFGLGMVVSHYSTTYIALALFILTYTTYFVIRKNPFGLANKFKIYPKAQRLSLIMVLGLTIFTLLWNALLTSTTSGLTRVISETYKNIGKTFSQEFKSGGVLYSLFSFQKLDTADLLNRYVSESIDEVERTQDKTNFYTKDEYEKYEISIVENTRIPLTSVGLELSKLKINPFLLNFSFRQTVAKVIQIFIIVGFVTLLLKRNMYAKIKEPEYIILTFVSMILLGLFIALPVLSTEYGTQRLFQQLLVILSFPLVIGTLVVSNLAGDKRAIYVSYFIFVIFFLSLSGFTPQATGDYYPQLHLNNDGVYYDYYYTHKSEVDSINWLAKNFNDKFDIYSNSSTRSKLLAITGLFSYKKILPATIRKEAYVYLDYSNVKNAENIISYKGDLIIYKYPIEFLNQNKNLIYSNGGAKIYK